MFIPDGDEGIPGNPEDEPVVVEEPPDGTAAAEPDKTDKEPKENYVPYSRFQEVIGERNKDREELKKLQEKMGELEKRTVSPQSSDKLFQDPKMQAFHDTFIKPAVSPLAGKIQALEAEIFAEKQYRWLDSEITRLGKSYPEMDKEFVAMLWMNSPAEVDLESLAKSSHEKLIQRDKVKMDTYLNQKKEAAKHKGGSPAGQTPSISGAKMPETLKTFDQKMKWRSQQAAAMLNQTDKE